MQASLLNGILIINKPAGFTSFDVVAKLRGILRERRIGHGGTLDPMATGVLPIFIGRATRLCNIYPDRTKGYTAAFRLGLTTDTLDITGTVQKERPVSTGADEIVSLLPRFTGTILQTPPMYSAVKIDGQKLYKLARNGVEIERPKREVTVHSCALTGMSGGEYTMDVLCSEGTYIRTIIADLGEELRCGAVMTSLVRTRACGFTLNDTLTLDEVQSLADSGQIAEHIRPPDSVLTLYPPVTLTEKQTRAFENGVKQHIALPGGTDTFRIYADTGRFLGTGVADEEGLLCVGKRLD